MRAPNLEIGPSAELDRLLLYRYRIKSYIRFILCFNISTNP